MRQQKVIIWSLAVIMGPKIINRIFTILPTKTSMIFSQEESVESS